jgi:hypothetical protein
MSSAKSKQATHSGFVNKAAFVYAQELDVFKSRKCERNCKRLLNLVNYNASLLKRDQGRATRANSGHFAFRSDERVRVVKHAASRG